VLPIRVSARAVRRRLGANMGAVSHLQKEGK
jgi:hypothetical protein